MNRLFRFEDPKIRELFDGRFLKSIYKRVEVLDSCVKEVEVCANLKYPDYYIEPILPIYTGSSSGIAVYYARTLPYSTPSGLDIVIQLTAALISYGSKSSLKTVLAHEFLHYLDLVRRMSKFEILSDEISASTFEAMYSDLERTVKPEYVYSDKNLIRSIKKKFVDGFEDKSLKEKTLDRWINKRKPVVELPPEENVVRIPVNMVLTVKFDPILLLRIRDLEKKSGLV
ncbi:MAG: hypothetical protein ABSB40_02920 [Nitrososphaeria archaeon]|jgi:hypothetical protein